MPRLSAIAQSRFTRLLGLWLPWLVLAGTLGATVLLWKSAQHEVDRELRSEFDYSVQKTVRDIEQRMETYKLLLHSLRGLFAASDSVTKNEFHTFVETLDLNTRYPGLQGLGISLIAPRDKISAHDKVVRHNQTSEHDFDPGNPDTVTHVIFIEPYSGQNLRALGVDMYSNPIQRTAMEFARQTNSVALSAKLILRQGENEAAQPGFAMYLPIHSNRNIDGRKPITIGWVYAQFHADDLMAVLSTTHRSKIALSIFDGRSITEHARLTHDTAPSTTPASRSRQMVTSQEINIAGHTWTLQARSLPALEARFDRDKPRIILFAGIGSSLLLAIMVQMLIHGRAHALRIAREMNSELIKSEFRWKYALEGAGEGVWDWDLNNQSIFFGPRLSSMLGYEELELTNNFDNWEKLLHPEDYQPVLDALHDYLDGHAEKYEMEGRMQCKDGGWKWVLMRGIIVSRGTDDKPLRMIGTLADITERHKVDESLKLASTVVDTMNEAVMITDGDARIVSVNPAFSRITGYAPHEVIDRNPIMLSDNAIKQNFLDDIPKALSTTGSWTGEIVGRRKSGSLYTGWISASAVHNQRDEITHYVYAFSDISERKANEQRMQYLAHFDPLTDLPNRALFNDRLRQALAVCRRNHTHLALMFIDLDKFKPVNDTLGHAVGDMLLKEVAYRLLDNIRESDTAARIGGDEFVVLLSGVESEKDVYTVAEKIQKAIQEPCELAGHTVRISASIGISLYPEHGLTNEEILTRADDAMYHAKHSGGASIASFSELPIPPAKST